MQYMDGSVYEGEFDNGMRHGQGRYITPDIQLDPTNADKKLPGTVYDGMWANDMKHGHGVLHNYNNV